MRFELDEASALLQTSTRQLMEKESPLAKSRPLMDTSPDGFSRDLYGRLAELGYFSLMLPEEHGGSGSGAVGLAVVLEEMGRVAFPGPYLDMVLAAEVCHRAGRRELLQRLLEGQIVLLARAETVTGTEPPSRGVRLEGGRLRGTKLFIPFGASADVLLVTAAGGIAAVERPAGGWRAAPLEVLDHAQRFVEVDFDHEAVLIAPAEAAGRILQAADRLAALGAAAMLLGLMQRSLDLAVAYLKERHAFGRPIGSFQALQHRAADMLLLADSSRSAVYRAAWACDQEPGQAPLLVASAKAYAGDAARKVCGETIQMFGGVGFTWEYDPHIYFKRVRTLELMYGSTLSQLEAALQAAGI